ncbi:hypothetical protein AOQ84DRAFT_364013 [Glonium stellatum]|uniref:F-box domain-containing protein n=1 Tax=Glonium stellatum TaxID=574774 RepID=A0A8E2F1F8_9PEZI|nr:hypothetical protein AOQ84DRAFT_364013 [Glonium stellatum]
MGIIGSYLRKLPLRGWFARRTLGNVDNLLQLPDDIILCILDFIIRKSDQRAICLTSRKLHNLVIKSLYTSVSFNIPEIPDPGGDYNRLLLTFLTQGNPGLQFVRKISIRPIFDPVTIYTPSVTHLEQHTEMFELMRQMLLRIPKNRLTHFRWASRLSFPSDLYETLWISQRNLKYVEFNGCGSTLQEQIMTHELGAPKLLSQLASVQSLRLTPDTPIALKVACEALDKMNIKDLEIDLRVYFRDVRGAIRGQSDGGYSATRVLREHITSREAGPLACLRRLSLNSVDFHDFHNVWRPSFDLRCLESLELLYCSGIHHLTDLIGAFPPASMRAIDVVYNEIPFLGIAENNLTIRSLNSLLQNIQPRLRRLCISVVNARDLPLDLQAVGRHGDTLEYLLIDVRHWGADFFSKDPYGFDKLEPLLSKCKRLRELGIPYSEFRLAIETNSSKFWKFFDLVLNLRLEVLLGFSPKFRPPASLYDGDDQILQASLLKISTALFRRFSKMKLRTPPPVLAFGKHEIATNVFNKAQHSQAYFFAGPKMIFGGRKRGARKRRAAIELTLAKLRDHGVPMELFRHSPLVYHDPSRRCLWRIDS